MSDRDWQAFVLEHGWYTRELWLARVLEQPIEAIQKLRRTGAVKRRPRRLDYGELFTLWHGRAPADDEWPAPARQGCRGSYEWLTPELALLARLVGTVSVREIATTLTVRLRQLTGDTAAVRNPRSVPLAINRLGLQSGTDLLGGLTTREAGKRVGRVSLIHQAIHGKRLRTIRVGLRHVIPLAEFERWLATREEPPAGWVRLSSLRVELGISSDSKLPEYASLGYIPDVRLVRGIGTARGVWFIAPDRAAQLSDDARTGRPMPWHGKPLLRNQRAMFKKWQQRRHRRCRTCAAIWKTTPPTTFDAFCARYGSLTLSGKRHLTLDRQKVGVTRKWRPRGSVARKMRDAGVTVYEAAALLQCRSRWIRGWIRVGLLKWGGVVRDDLGGEALRITWLGLEQLRAAAADEAARADTLEWMGVHVAANHTGVSITTVYNWRARHLVTNKRGPRGVLFERASLERQARRHWTWACRRFKRANPPAWVSEEAA